MISRRKFVTSVGASMIAAPFVNLLNGGAQAQPFAAPAKRLLIFFSPDGMVPQHYWPQGGENDFLFHENSVLTPLNDYRNDLLVLNGLDMPTGDNHSGGMAAMLTNYNARAEPLGDPNAAMGEEVTRIPSDEQHADADTGATNGMSVDQVVARHIGGSDRFPSMAFGVVTDPWGATIQTRMCYRGAHQYVHPDADPRSVFRRMFVGLSRDAAVLENLQQRRRSVLDLVLGDLNAIRSRVGRIERRKLDQHLQAIRDVERGLFPQNQVQCDIPVAPAQMNKDDYALVPQITRAQIDLAVTALTCQMTKVATVQLSHTLSPVVFSWVGNNEGHHELSHATDEETDRLAQLVNADRWCTEQFAYLIDRLRAAPNPEGEGSLMDDTLVLWVKEIGDSRIHRCESVPFVIAGNAGGAFRPGRYLQYDHAPHSRLLVSVCRAFGMDIETFGDPSTGTGGLDGLV